MTDKIVVIGECEVCGHEVKFVLSKEATLQSLDDMNWKQRVRDVIDSLRGEAAMHNDDYSVALDHLTERLNL